MQIEGVVVAFLAFCMALCVYGMVVLLRVVLQWRERTTALRKGSTATQSRRRLLVAAVLGSLCMLLGGALVAIIGPSFGPPGSFASYRGAVALTLAGVGIACVIVGARWDRAKGRRRCPRCWYSFEGLAASATCPECGRVPGTERRLLRTRRKPVLFALLPVMMAAAWYAFIAPVATSWQSYIPTTAMIAGYEWMPERVLFSAAARSDALEDRLDNDALAAWQRDWLKGVLTRNIAFATDPTRCARDCRLYEHMDPAPVRSPEVAAVGLNALHLLLQGDPLVPFRVRRTLFAFAIRHTAAGTTMRESDVPQLLAYSSENLQARNLLLARLAPGSPELIQTLIDEATDPSLLWQEHIASNTAITIGQISARVPGGRERLAEAFRQAPPIHRTLFGTMLVSSGLEASDAFDTPLEAAQRRERNTEYLREFLNSDEDALVLVVLYFTGTPWNVDYDRRSLLPSVARLAEERPDLSYATGPWLRLAREAEMVTDSRFR